MYRLIENLSWKNVTNGPKLITQPEAPASEEIVVEKLQTDLFLFPRAMGETNSGLTGETRASVTPGKRIPKKVKKKQSPAMSTPRKVPIPNQDLKTLRLQKYQCLTPNVPTFPHGMK